VGAPGTLELVVVRRAIRMRIILVVDLLHHVLLIVIARMVVIAVMTVTFPRHLRRRYRAVDARLRLQHALQGVRVQADAAVLRVLDSHVIGALALRSVTMIVIDDVEEIAVLHLQLGIVGRLGVVELLLTQRLALQSAAGLGTFRLQHLDAILLRGRVLALLLLLRRYRGFLIGAVDLWNERIIIGKLRIVFSDFDNNMIYIVEIFMKCLIFYRKKKFSKISVLCKKHVLQLLFHSLNKI